MAVRSELVSRLAAILLEQGKIGARLGEQGLDGLPLLPVEPAVAQKTLETFDVLTGDVAVMVDHGAT